jgi:hypothetical protein
MARFAIVLWWGLLAGGCTQTQTVAPGDDLAGAQRDFSTANDLASGADLSTGGGDLSTGGADLAGVDLSGAGGNDLAGVDLSGAGGNDLAGVDLSGSGNDLSGGATDLAGGADLRPTSDMAGGCGGPTSQPTIGYTTGTFTSNSALTFAIPTGYHVRGTLTLATLPAGASLDATDSFAIFVDSATGEEFDGTVTAAGANAVSYDAIVPPGTWDFNWGFTVRYAGSAFLGRQAVISNVNVCGDRTLDVAVPSFGAVTVATVNVSNLDNFGTSPSGSLDAIVEMHDAAQAFFAEGSQLAIASGTTTAQITMPLPMSQAMTPFVLGRVTGYDTAPGAGYFQTRVAFPAGIGGQTTYTLAIPTMAQLAGSLTASTDIDSGYFAGFNCFSPANDIYAEFTSIYYQTTFSAPYRPGGSCKPYTAAPIKVATTATNENSDGLLDLPSPNNVSPLSIVAGTNTIAAASVPAVSGVPITVLGTLTDAAGNPLASYTVSARSSSLTPAAFVNNRFRAEGGAPFGAVTDASGNFKLHLIPGNYSLVANP